MDDERIAGHEIGQVMMLVICVNELEGVHLVMSWICVD